MAEVGDIYPGTGERIVGKIPSGSGWIYQGEYGGVFAEGDAKFAGSYFDPNMAQHRNDPNRRFTGIEASEGGYTSISAAGERYQFSAPTTAPAAAATPPPTPAQQRATSTEGVSAKATLAQTLADYGLPASLVTTLWDQWYVNEARPFGQILMDLENTEEFKQRFPGLTTLKERRNNGEAVQIPSVKEYIALEAGISSVLRDNGLPPELWNDPTDYAKFIGGSTSPKEVEDRIALARDVAFSMPVETREELNRLYDIDQGELVAFVLDPDRTLPVIQKRILGGGIAGQAKKVGFGLLTAAEAEQLAASNVTEGTAAERFGELAMMGEGLFAETVEEANAGEDLDRQTQIGYAQQGEAGTAGRSMLSRRQRRAANFQGGGGAATGGAGRTGLGSS